MSTEIQLSPQLVKQFESLQLSVNEIVTACDSLTVTDDTTLAIATQSISRASSTSKQIEDLRKRLKQPSVDEGRAIDKLAKNFSDPLDATIANGKKKILAYDAEKKRIAKIETDRIQALRNKIQSYSIGAIQHMDKITSAEELLSFRQNNIVVFPDEYNWGEFYQEALTMRATLNDYAKARHIVLTTPTQADPETVEVIKEQMAEKVAEIGTVQIAATEAPKLSGVRDNWRFEIVDVSQIPSVFLTINEPKLKEWIKNHKANLTDGVILNGIRFFNEKSLTIK